MMNKKLILEILKESAAIADKRERMYDLADENEKKLLFESYIAALSEYDSLVRMVLAFGYMVQRDDNSQIIGIKRIK